VSFKYGPLLGAATIWIATSLSVLRRLRFDVSRIDAEVSSRTSAIPFKSESIYAVHRRLYPRSKMRKAFGFVVIGGAFTTLLFGIFVVLGV
jgi:hypothetical protein